MVILMQKEYEQDQAHIFEDTNSERCNTSAIQV